MSTRNLVLTVIIWTATLLLSHWLGRRGRVVIPPNAADASMLEKTRRHLMYWKVAYIHVMLLTAVSWGTFYLAQTDGMTGQRWAETSQFEKNRIYAFCCINSASVLIAFFNRTMARLDPDQYNADREADKNATAYALKQMAAGKVIT